VLAGHNIINFDIPFILAEFDYVKKKISNVEMAMLDTMQESRWATWDGKSPTLGELCYAFDVDYDPTKAHSALADVRYNLACILKGIEAGVYKC
jgi:DNA polymerase III alpha subunit (gram-positive type)